MTKLNDLFGRIELEIDDLNLIHNEHQLKDKWLTGQQTLRDKEITTLLKQYVKSYTKKANRNPIYRTCILIGCAITLLAVISCVIYVTVKICPMEEKQLGDIAVLITAYSGVLGTILSIMKIITKYIFPENEERYITDIVKAIQQNDLENKKVNINALIQNIKKEE